MEEAADILAESPKAEPNLRLGMPARELNQRHAVIERLLVLQHQPVPVYPMSRTGMVRLELCARRCSPLSAEALIHLALDLLQFAGSERHDASRIPARGIGFIAALQPLLSAFFRHHAARLMRSIGVTESRKPAAASTAVRFLSSGLPVSESIR